MKWTSIAMYLLKVKTFICICVIVIWLKILLNLSWVKELLRSDKMAAKSISNTIRKQYAFIIFIIMKIISSKEFWMLNPCSRSTYDMADDFSLEVDSGVQRWRIVFNNYQILLSNLILKMKFQMKLFDLSLSTSIISVNKHSESYRNFTDCVLICAQ